MAGGARLEFAPSGSWGLLLLVTLCLSPPANVLVGLFLNCGDCCLCGHRVDLLGTVVTAVDISVGPLGTAKTTMLIDTIG